MQEQYENEALRKLAEGTDNFFPIFICDAGYQVFGNVTHNSDIFKDFRELVEEAGAVFLGKYTSINKPYKVTIYIEITIHNYNVFHTIQLEGSDSNI